MKNLHSRYTILFILSLFLWIACSRETKAVKKDLLKESYQLVDRGENAQAILLLERFLKENRASPLSPPSSSPAIEEARILLSTAYIGEAGIDIYSMHHTFEDVLFARPLYDVMRGGGELDRFSDDSDDDETLSSDAPLERFVYFLSHFSIQFNRVISFLVHLPAVNEEKFALVEKGLELISSSDLSNDLRLYRLFVRMIYLKDILFHHWIKNKEIGTKKWLCEIDLPDLHDQLGWLTDQANSLVLDFNLVFPTRKSPFLSLHKAAFLAHTILNSVLYTGPVGANITIEKATSKLREHFDCENIK